MGRNRVGTSILYLLIYVASYGAAPVKIVGPDKVDPYKLVELSPDADTLGAGLIWDVSPEDQADIHEYGQKLVFTGPPGVYKVKLRVVRSDKDGKLSIETQRTTVIIGVPVPPTPPDPPTPPPSPAPIPAVGFRVLMLYDPAMETKLTQGQNDVLYGKQVRDYLNATCAADPQTSSGKAWWILGKDTDTAALSKLWQDAAKRPRTALPWVVVSDGTKGYEGPLPGSPAEAIDLFKKNGGK